MVKRKGRMPTIWKVDDELWRLVKPDSPLQMLITTLDYSDYVGRIGIGRVFAGTIRAGEDVTVIHRDGTQQKERVGELLIFEGLGRRKVDAVGAGDICAVVGIETVDIGNTIACIDKPKPLPLIRIDEPTLHMTFRSNDSPLAGRSGKFLTSRHLRDRLERKCKATSPCGWSPAKRRRSFTSPVAACYTCPY